MPSHISPLSSRQHQLILSRSPRDSKMLKSPRISFYSSARTSCLLFSISSFESTTRRLSPPQTPLSFRTKSAKSPSRRRAPSLYSRLPTLGRRTARTSRKTLSKPPWNTPPRRSFSTPPTRFPCVDSSLPYLRAVRTFSPSARPFRTKSAASFCSPLSSIFSKASATLESPSLGNR